MAILIIDTETTGFTNARETAEHPSQPHLVQLGCLLAADNGNQLAVLELIVRPDGWTIPEAAARVHGITTEIAQNYGVPLVVAVALFTNLRARADEIVAHNFEFDELVMAAAIHRTGRKPASPGPDKRTCTMRMAMEVMKLPPTPRMMAAGFNRFKPPNLGEAYKFFTDETLENAHSALVDTRACARIYFEMRRREQDAVPF